MAQRASGAIGEALDRKNARGEAQSDGGRRKLSQAERDRIARAMNQADGKDNSMGGQWRRAIGGLTGGRRVPEYEDEVPSRYREVLGG